MKDISMKRILRYTIATFIVMVLTAYGLGVGIASAESGTLRIDAVDSISWSWSNAGASAADWTTLKFDSSDYNHIQNLKLILDTGGFSQESGTTAFTITGGGTGSGVASFIKSTKTLSWYFTDDTVITSSPVTLSYANPNIFTPVSIDGGYIFLSVPDSTHPAFFATPAAPCGSCPVGGSWFVAVQQIVQNNYVVSYSTVGGQVLANVSIDKSPSTVNTKIRVLNYTGGSYFTETTFNTVSFISSIPYNTGLVLNMSVSSGLSDVVVVNTTGVIISTGIPVATITTDKFIYAQNSTLNYTISLSSPDTSSTYYLALYQDNDFYGYINFGSSSAITGTSSYYTDGIATGTYHLSLFAIGHGLLSYSSNNFTIVPAFVTDFDNIHTTKSNYNASETQQIYGYATTLSQIKIYSGATLISNKGTYTGIFNISANLPTGSYLVTMERNVNGHISIVTSVSYIVNNDAFLPISINMIDPGTFDCGACFTHNTWDRRFAIGNTANGGDGGQMITVTYNRKNNNDKVYIYDPQGNVFDSWTVNQYTTWLTSREFYVPNEASSIGLWTTKIIDATNASNFSTSTLTAFVYDNYVNNDNTTGNAIIQVSNNNPCAGSAIGISWQVSNLSTYVIKFYKNGENVLTLNDTYTSSTGSISVTLNSPSSTYYFKIMNATTFQTINQVAINTKSASECAAGVTPTSTPQTGNWTTTNTQVTSPCQFWDGWVSMLGQGINDITRFEFALMIISLAMIFTFAVSKSFAGATLIGFFPYAFFVFLSLSTSCGTYIPVWTAVFVALIIGIKLRWFS